MPDDLPTARSMLPQAGWLCVLVWCKACHHRAPADLQVIIDAGRGDVPLINLAAFQYRQGLLSSKRGVGP